MPSLLLQHGSETGQIFRPGILPDGAGDPLRGVIVLSGVERQQPHQVQGAGVIGIGGERLLAAQLGIQMPAIPHQDQAGLVERSGVVRALNITESDAGAALLSRRLLQSSIGRPAVATVHRRIFKWMDAPRYAWPVRSAEVSGQRRPALFHLDVGGLDHRPPFRDLGLLPGAERFRRELILSAASAARGLRASCAPRDRPAPRPLPH